MLCIFTFRQLNFSTCNVHRDSTVLRTLRCGSLDRRTIEELGARHAQRTMVIDYSYVRCNHTIEAEPAAT